MNKFCFALLSITFFLIAQTSFGQDAKTSVVKIEASSKGGGVICGYENNIIYIVTAYHVVEKSKEIKVFFFNDPNNAGEGYIGKINKNYDEFLDLAVIEVYKPNIKKENIFQLKYTNTKKLKIGTPINNIGHPLNSKWLFLKGENIMAKNNKNEPYLEITNKSIQKGNSGGIVFKCKRKFIGITRKNNAKITTKVIRSESIHDFLIENGIPSNLIKEIIKTETYLFSGASILKLGTGILLNENAEGKYTDYSNVRDPIAFEKLYGDTRNEVFADIENLKKWRNRLYIGSAICGVAALISLLENKKVIDIFPDKKESYFRPQLDINNNGLQLGLSITF